MKNWNLTVVGYAELRLSFPINYKHLMRKIILSLTLLLNFLILRSQENCFEQITDAHILSIEESFQFIWMGTKERGLLIYDKFTEELIELDALNSALETDQINSVTRYGGELILSADSAIYKLIVNQSDFEVINDSIGGELGVTLNGDLIVAGNLDYYHLFVAEDIVYQKNLAEEVTFSCEICEKTSDITRTPNGEIWVSHHGFYEFDILQFDGENWTLHDVNTNGVLPVESYSIHNRIMAHGGDIYATAAGSLYQYANSQWTNLQENGPLIITQEMDTLKNALTDIEEDNTSGYWVGSAHNYISETPGRLAYHDQNEWFVFDLPVTTPTDINRIYSSYIEENTIYVGTSDGLFIFDKPCGTTINIQDLIEESTIIYPNPSNDELGFKHPISSALKILDNQGKLVKWLEYGTRSNLLINALPSGSYFLEFTLNGIERRERFIVSR